MAGVQGSFAFTYFQRWSAMGKQKNILVCFNEMDVNVKNNEVYSIFHAFCWELRAGFYSFIGICSSQLL